MKVKPELEPYFRKASELINQRLEEFGRSQLDGEKDLEYFAYMVAIEGMMKAQVFHDKYELLQQEFGKLLDDIQNRFSPN